MKIKKRGLLLVSIFLTGILGILNGSIRLPFSKSDSALKTVARADTPSGQTCDYRFWTQEQCDCYFLGIGCSGSDGAGDCCAGGCGSCFPAGTMISTPTGNKEIEAFFVGDEISTFDPETGEAKTSIVSKTIKHSWDEVATRSPLIIVTHEQGVLTLTVNHPVYLRNAGTGDMKNFVEAGLLKIGDKLTLESGDESMITNIEKGPEYDFVYNLEVETTHTYIAENVRVHNKQDAGGSCGSCGSCAGDY